MVVADRAAWLWSLAELHFPEAIQVLDWHHLKARLCEVGEELYGADRDSFSSALTRDWICFGRADGRKRCRSWKRSVDAYVRKRSVSRCVG